MKTKLIFLGLIGLLFLCLVGALIATPAQASATFIVDRMDDTASATACTAAANDCSLRGAILAANALSGADTIILPVGTYVLTIAGTGEDAAATGDLDVTGDLTLSGNSATDTTINGNGIDRVIQITSTVTVSLSNMTITGGSFAGGMGGGVFNQGNLSVSNVTLTGNSASEGGGLASQNGVATIINTTVFSNTAPGSGGGIFQTGAMEIINSTISDNVSTTESGGIASPGGTLTITTSTISNNRANFSAGGGIGGVGTLSVSNSSIANNRAYRGGGIYFGGTVSITASSILTNVASTEAGGISNNFGTLTVISSTVSGNSAGSGNGGAIFNATGQILNITHSTLSGNSALNGGGISNAGTLTLTNSTLTDNNAFISGGGLSNSGTPLATLSNTTVTSNSVNIGNGAGIINGGTLSLVNSIIAGNTDPGGEAPDCSGTLNSLGYNLIQSTVGCTISGILTGVITNAAPLLGPLQNNGGPTLTHALLGVSPAVDAGDNTACPATDQRGVARPQDGDGNGSAICDIGAYELPPPVLFLPLVMRGP